jgi:nitroimidazol reductase NimA-like FMN-containing flavoprotein (pyridoxamine 5'-phosphate oxidase superfamily)
MFRELTRNNRQLSEEDCLTLLKSETRGVLSVLGDGDYPYGMPMNHYYCEEDGCIYFHCGPDGHRLDALRRHDRVSFCVMNQGVREENDWAYRVKSVIVFGRVEILDSMEDVLRIAVPLSRKFTQDESYIQKEIRSFAKETRILKLIPEHMCGKQVKES